MNIINKFKVNYNLKLLDDFVINNNSSEVLSLFHKTKNKNHELFFQLMTYYIDKYRKHILNENLFNNKIVFINSFELDDCEYLSDFFSFYFDNVSLKYEQDSLANAIAKDLDQLALQHFPSDIDFNLFIKFSEFFLNSLLVNQEEKNLFLKSSSAFFEAGDNRFIYPNTTAAYFFIHQNPINIYSNLKNKLGSPNEALNIMFNFRDISVANQNINYKYVVKENRQSWNIYSNSWTDPNVISTYRGLLISNEDFSQSPHETLTKVLFHLIQAGIKIEMNYDLIDQYIQNNPLNENNVNDELSNKEKKGLINNLDKKLLEYFNYQV